MAVSVSEKPWSDYTKADYTPEQWHAACIIHQHTGPVTSKNQCKLPVRTPTGTLNRNGVHAAAAALAGARGGVDASNSDKFAARRQLVAFYKQLGEEPPPSLSHSALDDFLAHYGVKGMLWGVRRGNLGVTRLDSRSDGAVKTVALNRKAAKDPGGSDAFKTAYSTSKVAKAINDSYADPTSPVQKFNQKWQKSGKASDPSQRDSYDKQYAKVLTKEANSNLASGSKAKVFVVRKSDGTTQVHMVISRTIRDRSARKNYQQGLVGDPTTEAVHADLNEETVIFAAILDKNGLIIGLKPVEEGNVSHTDVEDFLAHFGRKGMKWGVVNEKSGGGQKVGSKKSALHNEATKKQGQSWIRRSLGDKTYWKRTAVILGLGLAGMAVAPLAPALLPVSVVLSAGGPAAVTSMVTVGSGLAMRAASIANYVSYLHRRRALSHAELDESVTIQNVYDGMSSLQKDAAAVLVASAVNKDDVSDDAELLQIWSTMTDEQRATVYLLADISETAAEEEGNDTMAQDDPVTAFLAHHGIKGMKWGVRRGDRGGVTLKREGSGSKSESDSGSASGTHLSADAERFLNTRSKTSAEMSDREIKEANTRAEALKKYNATFNDPNRELRAKVEGLQLQKQYSQMQREMNPTKMQQVAKFAGSAKKGYDEYAKINDASGGKLNSLIGRAIGIKPKPETEGQRLTREIGLLKTKKEHEDLLSDPTLARLNLAPIPKHSPAASAGRRINFNPIQTGGKHRGP